MAIQSNRTLGATGAFLMVIGVISTIISIITSLNGTTTLAATALPLIGVSGIIGLLTFVGFILFLVAMQGLSKDYGERRIFSHVLNGFLFALVATIVAAVIWVAITLVISLSLNPSTRTTSGISLFASQTIGGFAVVISIITLVYMIFYYKAFNLLANKSGVTQFYTVGKILILSSVVNIALSIVFAVLSFVNVIPYSSLVLSLTPGAFIQYAAWAIAAKGYLAIQPLATPTPQVQPYTVAGQNRYCPNCGAQVQPSDVYCIRCGKKL